jgi:hypothetical protein
MLNTRLENKRQQEWNLLNPHKWADEKLGLKIYEKHILKGGEWLGWQNFQIAFLRDLCNLNIRWTYAICNRGGSKTWLTALGSTCLLDNVPGFKVNIISGSLKQAEICYRYMQDFFLDTDMKVKIKGESTMGKTTLVDYGQVQVLPATEKRARGGRVNMVIIDEVCEAKPSIITAILPQAITAKHFKIVLLTTPNKLTHPAKEWWDKANEYNFVKYRWTGYQCNWIPKENIEELKNFFTEADFRIEVLAEWTSKTGAVFSYSDIQKALCDMSDLPPMNKIDRFFLGIDWGDAHMTVATVVGMYGDPNLNSDRWFVYAVKSWQNEKENVYIEGIDDLCQIYRPKVISEQAPISSYVNKTLREKLSGSGITFVTASYTKKKHRVVKNFKARLEKGKLKIPRVFRNTIEQLTNYSYKEVSGQTTEDYQKGNDDFVDSIVWANWGIHRSMSSIKQIGAYEG